MYKQEPEMHVYKLESTMLIETSLQDTFAFFEDPYNLKKMTPSWMRFEVTSKDRVAMRKDAKSSIASDGWAYRCTGKPSSRSTSRHSCSSMNRPKAPTRFGVTGTIFGLGKGHQDLRSPRIRFAAGRVGTAGSHGL